jgi:outer membrane protein
MTRTRYSLIFMLFLTLAAAWADPTPPVMPKVVETPLPPAVALPAPESVPADVPNTPLSATEAAMIALRHAPAITVAQQGIRAAQGRLRQEQADLSPTVGISTGYTDQLITSGRGGNDGFAATVTVRKLLYDYHHTRDLVRQSAAQATAAQANLTRAQSDLVFQVKSAYYHTAQALRLVDVQAANLRNRQEHLAQAQARVQAGVGLPIDVVRAETAVADAALNLLLAQNTAAINRTTLAQLMGLDPRTPLVLGEAEEPAPQDGDLNVLLQTALARRPEISQATATVQANTYAVAAARSDNKPAVTGSLGYGVQDTSFPPTTDTLTLGVSVQWNAFDAGLTQGRVAETQANLESARAQLTAVTLTVTTDVAQAWLNAKSAAQRLTTAAAQVTNAQEAVRLAQGRYNAGLGIFIDVLDAQAALVTARTNQVNAQSALNQARAALAHALNSDPALAAQP